MSSVFPDCLLSSPGPPHRWGNTNKLRFMLGVSSRAESRRILGYWELGPLPPSSDRTQDTRASSHRSPSPPSDHQSLHRLIYTSPLQLDVLQTFHNSRTLVDRNMKSSTSLCWQKVQILYFGCTVFNTILIIGINGQFIQNLTLCRQKINI